MSREDYRLAEGYRTREGLPEKIGSIADLAGSGAPFLGRARERARRPACDAEGCVGRLESFLALLITHAVHVKVDRETASRAS